MQPFSFQQRFSPQGLFNLFVLPYEYCEQSDSYLALKVLKLVLHTTFSTSDFHGYTPAEDFTS